MLFLLVSPCALTAGGERSTQPTSKLVSAQPFMEQLEARSAERIGVDVRWTRDDRDPNIWTVTILGPKGWDKAFLLVDDVVVATGILSTGAITYNFDKHPPGPHRAQLALTRGRDYGFDRRTIRVVEPEGFNPVSRRTPPISRDQRN